MKKLKSFDKFYFFLLIFEYREGNGMTEEFRLFNLKNTQDSNVLIQQAIKNEDKVKIYRNKIVNGNEVYPSVVVTQILNLKPFEYIDTTMGRFDFVSRECLIKKIEGLDGKVFYDKTLVLNDKSRVGNDLSVARIHVLGADREPVKKVNTSKKREIYVDKEIN